MRSFSKAEISVEFVALTALHPGGRETQRDGERQTGEGRKRQERERQRDGKRGRETRRV